MNATKTLANYGANLKYEDLPPEVVEMAKKMILQTVGAALASKPMELTQEVLELGKEMHGGPPEATLMIDGTKTSILGASFTNSIIADNVDWEDCSWTGHPSASLVPVSLAIAEARGKTGKEVIEAVVAGFEIYQRIACAVQPPKGFDNRKGWGLTSWQIFAAAAPASKLLDLDPEKFEQALGLAAVLTPVPNNLVHATMSNVYHYQHGFCSQDGVLSALVAEHGVDGMLGAFDGEFSYGEGMTTDHKRHWYTQELGERYLIMETLLKHWPTNMWVQTSLDIVDSLVKEHNFGPDDVVEIIVDPPTQMRMMCYPEGFDKIIEAQYSIPFCIAALLCDPTPGPQWYTEKNLHDPQLLKVAAKVKSSDSEEESLMHSFDQFKEGEFAKKTLTVKLKDGRVLEKTLTYPKGHPKNPLTLDEVIERFRIQAKHTYDDEKIQKAIEFFANLEEQEDMTQVGSLLY